MTTFRKCHSHSASTGVDLAAIWAPCQKISAQKLGRPSNKAIKLLQKWISWRNWIKINWFLNLIYYGSTGSGTGYASYITEYPAFARTIRSIARDHYQQGEQLLLLGQLALELAIELSRLVWVAPVKLLRSVRLWITGTSVVEWGSRRVTRSTVPRCGVQVVIIPGYARPGHSRTRQTTGSTALTRRDKLTLGQQMLLRVNSRPPGTTDSRSTGFRLSLCYGVNYFHQVPLPPRFCVC
ncbi:hypothetical protein SUGI_1463330 [Cryptomeria japonica]|uniref:Uncharacterized protein n=1 Tax=Cryptomeria japonica TaxID=3369 RepID=A0AAD3NUY6_CRYJA|nr:hypothetical protein SUGI_1463330 [Cryptomeria japonica]